MLETRSFTGGIAATNGYWLPGAEGVKEGAILVDAPEGIANWLDSEELSVNFLLLTHGHYDHVMDVAAIKSRYGCEVVAFETLTRELTLEALLNEMGIDIQVEPFEIDRRLKGETRLEAGGRFFELLHVPGHSPDSICYFHSETGDLFAGDTLMAGGVGRSDLPGGNGELLISGIRDKILPLGKDVRVLSGHGPETTIGQEQQTNPFV